MSIALAFVAQAHAELRVSVLQQPNLDNTSLSVFRMPVSQQVSRSFGVPQQRPKLHSFQSWLPNGAPMIDPMVQRNTLTAAEPGDQSAKDWIQAWKDKKDGGGAPGAAPTVNDTPELWETNVFGAKIEDCPAGDLATCKYGGEVNQICVGIGARQRQGSTDAGWLAASDARSFVLSKPESAFQWNPSLMSECISVWDYTDETGTDFGAWLRYGNSDIIPKCDAVPAAVLKSAYTVETYSTCEYEAREYKYVSPKSSKWKSDNSVVTKQDPFFLNKQSIGETGVPKSSNRCARFRKAIDSICEVCGVQAKGAAQAGIQSQCDALKSMVPADQDDRKGKWLPFKVFRRGMPWKMGEGKTLFTEDSSYPALMSLFVASGLIFAALRMRRRTPTTAIQPLLASRTDQ